MNIFALSNDPTEAAKMQMDKHIVKMCLESAQMLCSALYRNGVDPGCIPYKQAHKNHPCTLWAGDSFQNWEWLYLHCYALNEEYRYRWTAPDHKSWLAVWNLLKFARSSVPHIGLTPFAQAMPEQYRGPDAVAAYRWYYAGEKMAGQKWTGRDVPVFGELEAA